MPQPQGQQPGRGKPGAMTMAMQAVAVKPTGPKVLRIGLIQDGKIVEERIIRRRETVTVGSSERNHFVVSSEGLNAKFELFQIVGDDYVLNFTDAMRGKVGLPGGVQQLEQLRSNGGARKADSKWQVKLSDTSRGKIIVGNTTLLFQFVVPPPVTPRPQLPAAARGGFVKSIDWLFTAFVVFSYMTFFGFVIYLENADWEIQTGIAAVPESVARLIFEEPPEPPPEVEPEVTDEVPTEEGEEEVVEEEQPSTAPTTTAESESTSSVGGGEQQSGESRAEANARIAESVAANAEALILGALGSGGSSALNDVLAGGAVTGSAADVLAAAGGVGVATAGTGSTLRTRSGGGDGSGAGGGLGMLATTSMAGMAASEGSAVMERRIRGRTRLDSGGGDIGGSGDFDAGTVVRTIRTRIRAIQRCYENELRRNPSLEGKVTVQFTIVERGTVTGARATENTTGSPAVASCVVSTVRRFRFNPGPEGGSVSYSYPFVFAPQN